MDEVEHLLFGEHLLRGEPNDGDSGLAIREAAKGFLVSLRASGRYSDRYLESLEGATANLATFAETQAWPGVAALTTAHLESYLAHLRERGCWFARVQRPISASTFETHYRRLKRFWAWLVQRGHADRNPFTLIPHPKFEERVIPEVLEKEIMLLLRLTAPALARWPEERFLAIRNTAILRLWWDTPIRRQELVMLRPSDLDFDGGMVKVMGKGSRERLMPIDAPTLEALWSYVLERKRLRLQTDRLWVAFRNGTALSNRGVGIILQRLAERAGVRHLSPHMFRHAFAADWVRKNKSERTLRVIGGWKEIPETYLRNVDLQDAARHHRELGRGDRLAQKLAEFERERPNRPDARGRL